ncbi:MAG TPA: malate synthase A, partial [Dehalococcoidia bacterium]
MAETEAAVTGIQIAAPEIAAAATVLTPDACAFLEALHREFEPRRRELLAARHTRQAEFDAGVLPEFPAESRIVRESEWKVATPPADLQDRRVE